MIETLPSPSSELIKIVPPRTAAEWGAVPLQKNKDGSVTVAVRNVEDIETLDNLRVLFRAAIQPTAISSEVFEELLTSAYGLGAEALNEMMESTVQTEEPTATMEVGETAIVRFVNDLLRQAHRDQATDIHVEPFEGDLLVRFRVDGLLHPVRVPPSLVRYQAFLTSRIKVLAQMNIAEKRLPQDGRFRFEAENDQIDIRVSTIPTIYGESIDLRLLPQGRMLLGLKELGLGQDHLQIIETLIHRPNGILLVTGPTGHGKTTTLYAFLSQINTPEKKIITIEEPVEYRVRGINQIQVHTKIGLTFANGLRSILRQDPDVIMVGEIRDMDTAEIAIRAALTGHLVFSTLHTNDSIGAVTRLMDMGIEPYLVASSVSAVLAQRLVRLSCRRCMEATRKNCGDCRGTGFKGRTGIFELLLVTEEIRDLILRRASAAALREKARAQGMKTLFEEGRRNVAAGLTSLPEILRVTEEM